MLSPDFAILGGTINVVGCASYALDTLKGKTKPNRVGWSLWATAPLVAFAAELSQGVKLQSLITLAAGVGPLLVLFASFADKKAYWKIKRFDWYCGALSIIALICWWLTGKGNVAILFSVCADLLACIPTVTKAYTDPDTESSAAFVAGFVGVIITLLTIKYWTFANYAFPIYLLIANGGIAAIILTRKQMTSKPQRHTLAS